MSKPTIKVVPPEKLAEEAAEVVIAAADHAIRQRGSFTLALSGGSTPKALYELLAGERYLHQIAWPKWEIFFGDERTVPPDHKESNYRMAKKAMLDQVPISPEHIHRMKGEIDPNAAAIEYGQMLKERFDDDGLDLILLGMGDDGHTASLFPHSKALDETKHRVVASWVEKLNTWRITMSAPFINKARQVLVIVGGASKAGRVVEVLEGPRDPQRLPIQMIDPAGELTWLMDTAAAGM